MKKIKIFPIVFVISMFMFMSIFAESNIEKYTQLLTDYTWELVDGEWIYQ